MKLTVKKFSVDFGAKATLEIKSKNQLTFHITEIDGKKADDTKP